MDAHAKLGRPVSKEWAADALAGIKAGQTDMEAGRWYSVEFKEDGMYLTPNPEWKEGKPEVIETGQEPA